MDVIGDAADPVDFAAGMAAECGEVGEGVGTDGVVEPRMPVFGGEDEMSRWDRGWSAATRICSSR